MPSPLSALRRHAFDVLSGLQSWWFRSFHGMDLGHGLKLSRSAKLDKTNPRGIHIGDWTAITFDAAILSHDMQTNRHVDTWIGSHCFIGAKAIIMPGVRVGDHSIVGAGSVVMTDVPAHSVVSGNPAKVVRSGITTGRWGITDQRFLDVEAAAGRAVVAPPAAWAEGPSLPRLPREEVLALFRAERPEFAEADLERPLVDLGIDSFALINLRVALEARAGRQIHDTAWGALKTPADLIGTPDATPAAASGTPAPALSRAAGAAHAMGPAATGAVLPLNQRQYRINMPQMALRGLAEPWLMKELGDLHWAILMQELRTSSASLADAAGDRLYATFTRIRYRSNAPLTDYRENERLAITMDEARYGAAMFFGSARIEGVRGLATAELMTTFSKYGEAGANTSLLKGQPVIPEECAIPVVTTLPDFATEYRALRAAETPPAIAEVDYDLLPPHDINGVGLLYFAAYPSVVEICLARLKGPTFAFDTSLTERDICYFANADPTDGIRFRLHSYDEDEAAVRYVATMARASDGKTMARIAGTKAKVKLPPPGRPVTVEE
jgi:probable biosynthetic protein (TIGR04098 family)